MSLRERMPMRLAMDKEELPTLKANASDPIKDRTGCSTSVLKDTIRFLGVAEFVVAGDVDSFRWHLTEAAKLQLGLFERSLRGEPIDPSYAYSILAYKSVFDALAVCDMATAEALARHTGGRPDWEAKHDHPFDRCLGHTLRAFVLGLTDQMAKQVDEFAAVCRDPENADFAGYATTFRALLHRDAALTQDGLSAVVKGHKNQIKRGGVFNGREDEVICVWGVGMANLARSRGLSVKAVDVFIPAALLCG